MMLGYDDCGGTQRHEIESARCARWYRIPCNCPGHAAPSTSCGTSRNDAVVAAGHLTTTNGHRRSVLIRYTTSQHATTMAQLAVALRRAGIDTPEPLMQLDDGRVSVDDFVDGTDLRATVAAGLTASADVAAAIVEFHAAPIDAPCRSAADDLAQIDAGLEGLALWYEPARRATDHLRRQLTESMPAPPRHPSSSTATSTTATS